MASPVENGRVNYSMTSSKVGGSDSQRQTVIYLQSVCAFDTASEEIAVAYAPMRVIYTQSPGCRLGKSVLGEATISL